MIVERMGTSAANFLIKELRRRRVQAGLTQAALGERVYCSDSQISAIETGSKPVTRKHLELVDAALKTDGFFVEFWDELVKNAEPPPWFKDWIRIEGEARSLRWFEPLFVPGLLQTEAYARAALRCEALTPAEMDSLVASRLKRQAVLTRDKPPLLFVVMDEIVLTRAAPEDRAMMAEQLDHLITCAELPNVHIHIVPSGVGLHAGHAGAFIIAETPESELVAYGDSQLEAQIVNDPPGVAKLVNRWEQIRGKALTDEQSLELMKKAAASWT